MIDKIICKLYESLHPEKFFAITERHETYKETIGMRKLTIDIHARDTKDHSYIFGTYIEYSDSSVSWEKLQEKVYFKIIANIIENYGGESLSDSSQ